MKFVFTLLLFFPYISFATYGVVVADDYKCEGDHMVLETSYGFTLAEWYSGSLYEGKGVYGDLHSYGFSDLYDYEEDMERESDDVGRIYIDDYMKSRDDALKWCFSK